jgi:hypothetical protein
MLSPFSPKDLFRSTPSTTPKTNQSNSPSDSSSRLDHLDNVDQMILTVKRFVHSCIVAVPDMGKQKTSQDLSTPMTPATKHSSIWRATPLTPQLLQSPDIRISKYMLDNVLQNYFKEDQVSENNSNDKPIENSIFSFLRKHNSYSDLSEKAKAIIQSINSSLSTQAVFRFTNLLPNQSNFIDASTDNIKSKLDVSLQHFFNSKDSFTEPEKETLTKMVTIIATDIASKGFFNPSSISNDSDAYQLVIKFIQFINDLNLDSSESLSIKPAINVKGTTVSRQLFPHKQSKCPLNIINQNRLMVGVGGSFLTVCALALCYLMNLKMTLLILILLNNLKMYLLISNQLNSLTIIKKFYV